MTKATNEFDRADSTKEHQCVASRTERLHVARQRQVLLVQKVQFLKVVE
jgi:hypothetical protein